MQDGYGDKEKLEIKVHAQDQKLTKGSRNDSNNLPKIKEQEAEINPMKNDIDSVN